MRYNEDMYIYIKTIVWCSVDLYPPMAAASKKVRPPLARERLGGRKRRLRSEADRGFRVNSVKIGGRRPAVGKITLDKNGP